MNNKYKQFVELLNSAKKHKDIILLCRGDSKESAFKKLGLEIVYNTIEQFAEKLYFYGEKSKYFWNKKINSNSFDFDINDTSDAIFIYIFLLFKNLIQSPQNEASKKYLKKNRKITLFFENNDNQEVFIKTIMTLSDEKRLLYRNYYFRILHQLGKTDYYKNSMLISSSTKKSVAKKFSKGGIIINFWDFNFNNDNFFAENLPYFVGKPYKEQKEISLFAAILPHYIYSFECDGYVYPNPSIETTKDLKSAILGGLEIQQDNFVKRLKSETFYAKGISRISDTIYWEI